MIYALKTTVNQEQAVANLIVVMIKDMDKREHGIKSILVPDELKGYVLIEAAHPDVIEQIIQNIPHAKGLIRGDMKLEEVEHFLTPKPSVTGIMEGSIIEIVAGPFKGEKARVKKVDEAHEELTIELFEAMVPIPVTVRGDSVRVLSKEEKED
ncbi:MAG: transcription elongation factor Spt5 [Methanophagales archaeon]|nr:transcription elongation factor Spt5 [Methanophagales archaeon]RLG35563.1 MAG: transcription elongation factor Spt5 [Methanosarcinales archaeon]MCW3138805.1 transcription elongation factor Spt5 [Methanophagales archaeon]MCW3139505.1 transcription elongation factor Spt5 [Methanophagales archaeon]MCW7069389.1 transcription elongation factor Spt5 [Methanophagales archaeon]